MTRLETLLALYEECGDAEAAGRIAYWKNDSDNPFWEAGASLAWQNERAIAWLDGWQQEAEAETKRATLAAVSP